MTIEQEIVAMATSYQYIIVWTACCVFAFMALCAYCNSL